MTVTKKTGRFYTPGKAESNLIQQIRDTYVNENYNVTRTAIKLKLSRSTIYKWINNRSISKHGRKVSYSSIVVDEFIKFVLFQYPETYIYELQNLILKVFNEMISKATLHRKMVRLGFSRKRLSLIDYHRRTERVVYLRRKWRYFISNFHPSRYVWVDESHINRK